jgi:hypothetical protein
MTDVRDEFSGIPDDIAIEATSGRPRVNVTNPAIAAEWLRQEVGTGALSGIFRRGPKLVHTPREGEEGYIPPKDDADDDGLAQVQPMTTAALAAHIQFTYECVKERRKKDGETVTTAGMFPDSAARTAVEAQHLLPNVRPLASVVHAPVLRADGSVLAKPGYDDATRILYLPPPGLVVPQTSVRPTAGELAAAVALLDEMVAGFNFVSEHHRANFYGMLLTPLCIKLLPPPYKLGVITAPQPGSGKTLLANIIRILWGGVFRSEMPEDNAELRKQITSILDTSAGPIVHIDNCTGVLNSSVLAGLITSPKWGDRKLGTNEVLRRDNDRLWLVTGNNVTLGGDMPRRSLWVTIDPGMPNPHLRTDFAIRDLEGWVRARRGELIAALLTMARHWVARGRPTRPRGGDSFKDWIEGVDGILACAGVAGMFDDRAGDGQVVGVEDDDWREFLEAVEGAFPGGTWTVADLLGKVNPLGGNGIEGGAAAAERPIPLAVLPGDLADRVRRAQGDTSVIGKSLGRWLGNRAGRWAGDEITVRPAGVRHKAKMWRIERIGGK